VMNGSVVGKGSIVAAGAVVTEGAVIPPYSLVAGIPGVVKKALEPGKRPQENNARDYLMIGVSEYVKNDKAK
ncbi:MAG: gamma carbonic anhydrase family protein, partial [Gordonibacter sp.]